MDSKTPCHRRANFECKIRKWCAKTQANRICKEIPNTWVGIRGLENISEQNVQPMDTPHTEALLCRIKHPDIHRSPRDLYASFEEKDSDATEQKHSLEEPTQQPEEGTRLGMFLCILLLEKVRLKHLHAWRLQPAGSRKTIRQAAGGLT
jgi:hypothetical protein